MLKGLFRHLVAGRARSPELAEAQRHFDQGELEAAERICRKLIVLGRSTPGTFFLQGLIAQRQGRLGEAVAALRMALEARSDSALYALALGQALIDAGEAGQAIDALSEAARLSEGSDLHGQSLLDLGRAYLLAERSDEAQQCCRRLLQLEPDNPVALRSMAALLFADSDIDAAQSFATRCLEVAGDAAARLRRALMLPVIPRSLEEVHASRQSFERELDEMLAHPPGPLTRPEEQVGRTAFYLAYQGANDRTLMQKLAQVYRIAWTEPSRFRLDPPARGRKLRVGFVSSHFGAHSVGKTSIGLIRDLPKDRFETFVFTIAPKNDPMARRIETAADHCVSLPAELAAIRDAIAGCSLHALVFTDIGMAPITYFLAFYRLATLQLTTWGHPVTSGIDTVDWYLSAAALELADGQSHYSEKLIAPAAFFLPGYRRPQGNGAPVSRDQLGLPANGALYLCPQSLFKMHPAFDRALAAILEQDGQGHLLLLGANPKWTERLRARLAARMGRNIERVHFLPRAGTDEFLARFAAADVVLDPFLFGGCNTTFEAIATGTPVVTLPAEFLPGRFTLACYRELGVEDCIAGNEQEYIRIAVALASDPERRRDLSRRLLERADLLFERPDAPLALASALEEHFA